MAKKSLAVGTTSPIKPTHKEDTEKKKFGDSRGEETKKRA